MNIEDAKTVGNWLFNRLTADDYKNIIKEELSLIPHPRQLILKPRITLWDIRCLQMGKFPPDTSE